MEPTNELIKEAESKSLTAKKDNTRLVKNYVVFTDDFLGKGQYGQVCKAKLVTEIKDKNAKIYACKIMEIVNIS